MRSVQTLYLKCGCGKTVPIQFYGWYFDGAPVNTLCPDCGIKQQKEIQKLLRDPEIIKLGFVTGESGKFGCCTMPCCGGKMPRDKTATPCMVVRGLCSNSPVEMMTESKNEEIEKTEEATDYGGNNAKKQQAVAEGQS